METIVYDDFKKLDMRVGRIAFVEPVEGADKLLRCLVDFGNELGTHDFEVAEGQTVRLRQIVSGIRPYFPEYKSLEGKFALYCVNLEPREIKGVTSYGMLMAVDGISAPDAGEGTLPPPIFLIPEGPVHPGTKVR